MALSSRRKSSATASSPTVKPRSEIRQRGNCCLSADDRYGCNNPATVRTGKPGSTRRALLSRDGLRHSGPPAHKRKGGRHAHFNDIIDGYVHAGNRHTSSGANGGGTGR